MVLHAKVCGRVGRCREASSYPAALERSRAVALSNGSDAAARDRAAAFLLGRLATEEDVMHPTAQPSRPLHHEDAEFLSRFEAAAFSPAEYGHREHLRTAWLY